MKNNLLLLIVAVAFLAAFCNLVWETWDCGFPTDLAQPDSEIVNNKEFWDLLITLIFWGGIYLLLLIFSQTPAEDVCFIKTPVGAPNFFTGWADLIILVQTRVGTSSSNITWLVHLTDLHLSKFYAPERTDQLQQLGKSRIEWDLALSIFPFIGKNQ